MIFNIYSKIPKNFKGSTTDANDDKKLFLYYSFFTLIEICN